MTPEEIFTLIDEGATPQDLADRLGCSYRTATRWRARWRKARGQDAWEPLAWDKERALELLDAGLPATWVAEEVGVSDVSVRKFYRQVRGVGHPAGREFLSQWSHIRRHETLLNLHREFAPAGAAKGLA